MISDNFIFTLHRIGDYCPTNLRPNENMKISSNFLEKFVIQSRRSGWKFVSIDEIVEATLTNSHRKLIALTFDDGYLDNFTLGYPLLSSYDVPFCVYLTTNFLNNDVSAWWLDLEQFLINSTVVDMPNGLRLSIPDERSKEAAFFYIRTQLMSSMPDVRALFFKFIQSKLKNKKFPIKKQFMDWSDVVLLAKSPLVTLGGHTISHPVLSALSEDEILYEMKESKNIIQKMINQKVKHFAYPFGGRSHIPVDHKKILDISGYETAVTSIHGKFTSKDVLSYIPRVMLVENLNFLKIYQFMIKQVFKKLLRP